MSNEDKTILISGMMFNVTFFLSMMLNIFITNAIAFAIVASTVTYLFFDKLYYAQKKTDTHANE
ncbi:MAG: hypothetical protein NRZ54_11625 [Staphylococcus haemolyticus]|uniref:hypothetical protein n=1 Tax=Staphylococcus haemolyticus TaxID=1283 RepID=UPI000FF7F746|nr:hypothetical protein [Staphylococcus haemolyticus]MCE4992986.1 hypothetical protein [Staphylococcus haemolyticus]RIO91555.1 hypothetical protein BUZ39_06705 [Staphylococcus haemolyticus]UVD88848.1 hypothetical protein NRZ53_09025 [Staphylococcus haemolyticus]WAI21555.1 MAG: hypothetical protein NRZ55_05945 [Staphylococcus haemolyticus]WAI22723.1 MAG: hypothetical protein NRZ54_11625 [Staphylococcus haemolyticus]